MSIISQFLKSNPGRHLAVQWFGLCDFTVVAQFQSLVWELKSLKWRGKKKKKEFRTFYSTVEGRAWGLESQKLGVESLPLPLNNSVSLHMLVYLWNLVKQVNSVYFHYFIELLRESNESTNMET